MLPRVLNLRLYLFLQAVLGNILKTRGRRQRQKKNRQTLAPRMQKAHGVLKEARILQFAGQISSAHSADDLMNEIRCASRIEGRTKVLIRYR